MRFTVLVALTSLGLIAARPLTSVSPRGLRPEHSPAEAEDAKMSWNLEHEPTHPLPQAEKNKWDDLTRLATTNARCRTGKILCLPREGEPDVLERHGRHVHVETEREDPLNLLTVYEDGHVHYDNWGRSLRDHILDTHTKMTWNPLITEKMSSFERKAWEDRTRVAAREAGCHVGEISCLPLTGYPEELRRHGKHVFVKTDRVGTMKVYEDDSVKYHNKERMPQTPVNQASSSSYLEDHTERMPAYRGNYSDPESRSPRRHKSGQTSLGHNLGRVGEVALSCCMGSAGRRAENCGSLEHETRPLLQSTHSHQC